MSAKLGTRIIDGDGHIMEDNAGIINMHGATRRSREQGSAFQPWINSWGRASRHRRNGINVRR